MTILVLTADPLPLPGLTATGAGLRAWSLAKGLCAAGVDARAAMPASILTGRFDPATEPYSRHVYPDASVVKFIEQERPEAVVLQHWGMMARVGDLPCPVAIDLAGPHLLERRLWGQSNLSADQNAKIAALRRADFVVCSGQWQRMYFLPWLMEAGFDPADPTLCPAIPFSWAPEGPLPRSTMPGESEELTFVSGGVLLPWQNPLPSLEILLAEMDQANCGRLIFCGGAHPSMNVAGGETVRLLETLEKHPRVQMQPLMPFDDWLKLISTADVAFDLLPFNNERQIAFPTRTSMYLWSGLPVIHADYDELGSWIQQSQAGWALDPENEGVLRQTIRSILLDRSQISRAAANARTLGEKRLNWATTIGPLADYCRNPRRRNAAFDSSAKLESEPSTRELSLQRDLELSRSEAAALKGKWPFRLARRLKSASWLLAPVVYPVLLLFLSCVFLFLKLADLYGDKRKGRASDRHAAS